MAKAVCMWGDGPAVLMGLEGQEMVLLEKPTVEGSGFLYGKISKGCLDFTTNEARQLAFELINAANEADSLEQVGKDHDDEQREIEETHKAMSQKPEESKS